MKTSYKAVLANRNYRKSLAASLINRFGDSIDAIASSWIVYEITGTPAWSAIVYAINRLPSIFITPLAGPWVERHEKKKVMVVTDLIRAVCVGILATCMLLGILNAPIIAALSLVISTAEAFRIPAGSALQPKLVERDLYAHASSLNQSLSSVTELVGTASAAIIIAAIGSAGAIYIDMATFLLSALIISTLRITDEDHMEVTAFHIQDYLSDLKDGFTYCGSNKVLLTFGIFSLFLNGILVPLNSLQSPMIDQLFAGGPEFLSVLGITLTVSMLLGSVIFPVLMSRLNGKIVMVSATLSIAGFYFGLVALSAVSPSVMVSLAGFAVLSFALGFVISIANMFAGVTLMKVIDPGYMARVNGIAQATGSAITPIIAFAVSGIVGFASVSGIFIGAGAVAVLFAVYPVRNRSLSSIQTGSESTGQEETLPEAS